MNLALFLPAIAEIFLAFAALVVVILGAFSKPSTATGWFYVAMLAIVFSLILAVRKYTGITMAFDRMFIQDNLALAFKCMIGAGAFLALALSIPYFTRRNAAKFEYPLIILLATIGMFGMVSAQDFLGLYVSLELQSLSLYVLASFHRDDRLSAEAGLKYFFLGALSSGILLYGISLLYGYTGSTSYITIANTLAAHEVVNPGVIIGLVLVLCGIGFKVAAAPFHMWAPDVYQGAPTPVTALFAMAPKAAAIGVICRLISSPFAPVFEQTQQILVALSIISMAVGAFAAIAQRNVKRLMAYSSIGHIGFILLSLAAGGQAGINGAIFYSVIYIIMSAGSFATILAVYDAHEGDEQTAYFSGLAKRHPVFAASFAALLLSMAGIPPFVGFFAKVAVFTAAVQANLTWLVVLGVLFSVVSAFYYLRLIKIMYFDAPFEDAAVLTPSRLWVFIAVLSALLNLALLIYPAPLSQFASWASQLQ
ncbi:MAG: nuoN [Alphaproteobacteria bacterium]|nr:nuoN [Alphaproteobacteria bacterium]